MPYRAAPANQGHGSELSTWGAGTAMRCQIGWGADRQAVGEATQPLLPGSLLKNFSNLPSTSLNSSASAGGSPRRVMFGHCTE